MALALAAAGVAGGLASSFAGGRDAVAQQATTVAQRYHVAAWAWADAKDPRHGAFIVDAETGDTWAIVGRYVEAPDAAKLCKTDYPQGLQYVGRPKK